MNASQLVAHTGKVVGVCVDFWSSVEPAYSVIRELVSQSVSQSSY